MICLFQQDVVFNVDILVISQSYLEGGHSCSFVFGAHVLLQHCQRDSMRTQVTADELDVHPELAEHDGLGQALALLP